VQVAAVGPLSGGHGSSLPIRDRNGFVMPEQLRTESNRERRWFPRLRRRPERPAPRAGPSEAATRHYEPPPLPLLGRPDA
jgi:hypothetical protein